MKDVSDLRDRNIGLLNPSSSAPPERIWEWRREKLPSIFPEGGRVLTSSKEVIALRVKDQTPVLGGACVRS